MARAAVLGIDLGTSSVRAMLVNDAGTVVSSAMHQYPIATPHPGWAEQDPDDWWSAACRAVRECGESASDTEVRAVSFSGQMHGTVILDRSGTPIGRPIIWCDQRSADEVGGFLRLHGREWLAERTANPLATGFQLASLLWLRKHRPDSLAGAHTIVLPKDYLRGRMTGVWATESSDACSTLLFDTAHRRWSHEVIEAARLEASWFPEVREATDPAGSLTPAAAEEMDLPSGIPVFMGGGDTPVTQIGNGVFEPGQVLSTIGSGGQLCAPSADPRYDARLRTQTFCHVVPDRWYIMGAILSAGLSLRWLRQNILGPDAPDYATLAARAAAVPPGAEGLIFLPYLTGERTPHLDPHACGVFFGLSPRHTDAHLVRAVMEGVVMALSEGLDIIRGLGIRPRSVVAAGGGARSPLWRQIQADLYGYPVTMAGIEEQAAYGAALLAGVGLGWWANVRVACEARVRDAGATVEPSAENRERYEPVRSLYRRLYPALRELMAERSHAVSELRTGR